MTTENSPTTLTKDTGMTSQTKKYIQLLITFLTPYISTGSGAVAAWILVKLHFLGIIHLTSGSLAKAIASLVIFGITAGLTYLTAHTKLLPLLEKWVEQDIIGGLPTGVMVPQIGHLAEPLRDTPAHTVVNIYHNDEQVIDVPHGNRPASTDPIGGKA